MTQSSQAPSPNADPSLSRQVQTSAPAHDPQPYDGPPKVDPGDSGASVGSHPDLSGLTADLDERIARETAQGFRGYNPDPNPNEAYTVAGVTGGAQPGQAGATEEPADASDDYATETAAPATAAPQPS